MWAIIPKVKVKSEHFVLRSSLPIPKQKLKRKNLLSKANFEGEAKRKT